MSIHKRCTYEKCKNPELGDKFYHIKDGEAAGGQDWSFLRDAVLCKACMGWFGRRGTLRVAERVKPPPKRCMYNKCEQPEGKRSDGASMFFTVEEGIFMGNRDWSGLMGKILCKECYTRFQRTGSLEKIMPTGPGGASGQQNHGTGPVSRCSFGGCANPYVEGSMLTYIQKGRKAGGLDWSPMEGHSLCTDCYRMFLQDGMMTFLQEERSDPVVHAAGASKSKKKRDLKHDAPDSHSKRQREDVLPAWVTRPFTRETLVFVGDELVSLDDIKSGEVVLSEEDLKKLPKFLKWSGQ